jgi:hypothetical protein
LLLFGDIYMGKAGGMHWFMALFLESHTTDFGSRFGSWDEGMASYGLGIYILLISNFISV